VLDRLSGMQKAASGYLGGHLAAVRHAASRHPAFDGASADA
jgi:hypothetical protein